MSVSGEERPTPPSRGLLRASGVVAAMTFVSRIFGLVRDMVIAYYFGAGAHAEAFVVAFRIPNLFRRLFAEGSFSQAFVPVLTEYKTLRPHEEVRALVDRVAGNLGAILLGLTALAIAGAPALTALFAPGFLYGGDAEQFTVTYRMLRITFPYLMLISLTALCSAILNSYGRFAVPAFTPVLLNLSLILGAVFLSPHLEVPVMALAWAVLAAGFAQLLFQLPFVARLRLLPRPRVDRQHEGVRRILMLMLPALFGVSVGQINLLFDTVLASFLETGSIPWLYYSDRLLELPLALFGIAIATVILPDLSATRAASSTDRFAATMDWGVRMVVLVGVPATIALVLLAEPLIIAIFQRGDFTERDAVMANLSLKAYAVGLLGHMLVKVLAPGYFARQDTTTPMRIGVIALVSNMVLNLILIFPLAHAGLALATSISAFINAGLLFAGLYRAGVYRLQGGWPRFGAQVAVAGLVLVAVLLLLDPGRVTWLAWDPWTRIGCLLGICAAGGIAYFGALALVGLRLHDLNR